MNSLRFVQASDKEEGDNLLGAPSTVMSEITIKARDVSENKKDLYLVAAVGQEHRLGRWYKNKLGKNSVKVIKFSM